MRQAAARLGYNHARNDLARRLALRKSGQTPLSYVIGLLLPGQLGKVRFFFELFRGIAEEASARGFGLLTLPSYDPVAHQSVPIRLPPSVWRGEVDGLIVHQGLDAALLRKLRREPAFGLRPIVSLTSRLAAAGAVLRDEREGARLALEHLLRLGHRRILYVRRTAEGYPGTERHAGYEAACAEAGLSADQCLLPVCIEQDHLMEAPLRDALQRHPDATALLTLNDPNALHTCYALERLGVPIPDRMSVVGWDDTDALPDPVGRNRLTSVAFDLAEMGRTAVRLTLAALGHPGRRPAEITMPARLVVRQTTAVACRTGNWRAAPRKAGQDPLLAAPWRGRRGATGVSPSRRGRTSSDRSDSTEQRLDRKSTKEA